MFLLYTLNLNVSASISYQWHLSYIFLLSVTDTPVAATAFATFLGALGCLEEPTQN